MATLIETESTLTDRYQTTIPETVRRTLNLGKRDKISYAILPNGSVVMKRAEQREDPVLDKFLDFLAHDIESNPQNLQALTGDLRDRIQNLVGDVDIDMDAPLLADDE